MNNLLDPLDQSLLEQAPSGMQEKANIQCCCGRQSCAFLEHSNAVLEGLEKDLLSAARIGQACKTYNSTDALGQELCHRSLSFHPIRMQDLYCHLLTLIKALLARHESHMVEAEEERIKMSDTIDRLETEKKELETSNAQVIAENRELLNQLEEINNQVTESNIEIQSLTTTLASTREELQRLTVLATRAAKLETQLMSMETEHAALQNQLSNSQDENHTIVQRWRKAEGTVLYLQEQVDKIEKEAREERERHVEVMGRLERRRTVERELERAAGRLKGAAATKSLSQDQPGTNVVSHFVRDILQDNANLQLGVIELREMLSDSNLEVENLREQLLLHQPIESAASTLKAELGAVEKATANTIYEQMPEVHVHHHYHGPEITVKKSKKKRAAITHNHFVPSSASHSRHHRSKEWRVSSSSAATILSQTSVTVPPNRWSMQSTQTGISFAPSSIPSSPRRSSSLFDSLDNTFDSRPSTPDSSIMGSSPPAVVQSKATGRFPDNVPGLAGHRSISTPAPLQLSRRLVTSRIIPVSKIEETISPSSNSLHDTILEESEIIDDTTSPDSSVISFPRGRHRRAASHESLFSLSERQKPLRTQISQNFNITGRGFSPVTYSPTTASITTEPLVSHATVSAQDMPSQRESSYGSKDMARSLLSQASGSPHDQQTTRKSSSGWAWGKWGKVPVPIAPRKTPQSPLEAILRSPGVNQSGAIRGFKPKRTPSNIEPNLVDEDSLRDALEE
jgi:hypothetical protein